MVEWVGNEWLLELKINDKIIGILEEYNDCDENFGWSFSWKCGIMEYVLDTEYFSVSETEMLWSEFENVKKRVLAMVKDVLGGQYLESKHLYESICKEN